MATGKQGVGGLWWPGKGAGKLWWCCAAGFGFLTPSSGRGGSTIEILSIKKKGVFIYFLQVAKGG